MTDIFSLKQQPVSQAVPQERDEKVRQRHEEGVAEVLTQMKPVEPALNVTSGSSNSTPHESNRHVMRDHNHADAYVRSKPRPILNDAFINLHCRCTSRPQCLSMMALRSVPLITSRSSRTVAPSISAGFFSANS